MTVIPMPDLLLMVECVDTTFAQQDMLSKLMVHVSTARNIHDQQIMEEVACLTLAAANKNWMKKGSV